MEETRHAGGQPESSGGGCRGGSGHRRQAGIERWSDGATASRRGKQQATLDDQRQRGSRLWCSSRRRTFCGGLPDHTRHRSAGMAGAQTGGSGRHPAASRRRTGFHQYDHWRVVWRRTLTHGHFRAGFVADDRGHWPGGGRRSTDCGGRRDARRSLHRHSRQERAGRLVLCRERPAWRRAAPGGGAHVHW